MKVSYRPEIDGLRAVAVVTVILYHARLSLGGGVLLQGGYLGVDIFFVISGFLISRILLSELTDSGRVDVRNFYARRIRRILPVLFTVMLVSMPVALMNMLPDTYAAFSRSILSSLLFVSNMYFYGTTTQYGASDSLLEPFLHTWSLSVEEQYYILFPVTLFLLFRFARRYLLALTLAGLLASLGLAELLGRHDPALGFYGLPTRMWELLTGTVLALIELRHGPAIAPAARRYAPALGVALVAGAIWMFDAATPHPGMRTVPLIVGTALLIRYANGREPVGALLRSRPAVGIGLISYSLYLWHFPVFAFARIANPAPGVADKLWWLALTAALSVASYVLIETPFRNRRSALAPRVMGILRWTFLAATSAAVAGLVLDGFSWRVPAVLAPYSSRQTWNDLRDGNGVPCHARLSDFCLFGADKPGRTVVVIGDSHGSALLRDLYERVKDSHPFLALTDAHCLPVFRAHLVSKGNPGLRYGCTRKVQDARRAAIAARGPAIVVAVGRWPLPLEGRRFDNTEGGVESENLDVDWKYVPEDGSSYGEAQFRTFRELLGDGNDLVLVYPLVEAGWNVPKELYRRLPKDPARAAADLADHPLTVSYDGYRRRTASTFALFDRLQDDHLYRVYPHKAFCNTRIAGRCQTHDNVNLFYADDNHPNATGAAMIDDLIMEKINLIDAQRLRSLEARRD